MKTEVSPRIQKLNDVRAMIDWLESHEDVPLPFDVEYPEYDMGWHICVTTKEELINLTRSFGDCEKEFKGNILTVRKRFGGQKLFGYISRDQVCEKIVLSTEVIPEHTLPAVVIPEKVKEKVEWRCHSILGE